MIALIAFLLLHVLSLVSLGLVLRVRAREREVIGAILASELPGRSLRHVGSLGLALAGVALALADLPADRAGALAQVAHIVPVLGVLIAVHELRPSAADRVCGSEGVRRGWTVRSFGELEEWRLLGLHLRFRLFGEWTAVNVPAEGIEALRARLMQTAGDRESAFNQ